jgi:hypothetical protein
MLFNKRDEIITDPKSMADLLQDQFSSVFSDPECPNIETPQFESADITKPLTDEDFVITDEAIISAIKEISSDSACGPDGVPVCLLKQCPQELCEPINLIWIESFNLGVVPNFYKDAHISPLYKKGNRAHAVNYRPVALTSHIIKIYKRILRSTMVKY